MLNTNAFKNPTWHSTNNFLKGRFQKCAFQSWKKKTFEAPCKKLSRKKAVGNEICKIMPLCHVLAVSKLSNSPLGFSFCWLWGIFYCSNSFRPIYDRHCSFLHKPFLDSLRWSRTRGGIVSSLYLEKVCNTTIFFTAKPVLEAAACIYFERSLLRLVLKGGY